MKKLGSLILLICWVIALAAQDKPAYQFFNEKGKKVKYAKVLDGLAEADVILFGEIHNMAITHWLQLQLTKDLHQKKGSQLILGMEMFEQDNQVIIDEYFADMITQKYFEDEARLWANYDVDYKPLLEYAKTNGLQLIASNIPRRYANMVYNKGIAALDDLSPEAKAFIAPLPIEVDLELPGYKGLLEMMAGTGHSAANFPHAQAVKDATMGWFISQALQENKQMIHFNGSFHSDNFEGIVWYLNKFNPNLKVATISNDLQTDISSLSDEAKGKANFILILPEDAPTTK